MRASPLPKSALMRRTGEDTKSTAYWIFKDPVGYELDYPHFKMMNNSMRHPIVTDGSKNDMDRITSSLIATSGSIMSIVDQFIQGGTIRFTDPNAPARVYARIAAHLEAHIKAMRSNVSYDAPDAEDFRQLAEFATSIRHLAVLTNPNIDKSISRSQMERTFELRPRFSDKPQEEVEDKPVIAKPTAQMDAIERFLEINYGG